ncbi:SOS response-associated peptidase family protein [Cupriavidus sp. RAF20_2]|uniref:SOS response-associated peptidase family protein n=1 Tax=Cupriavidus sp. RAF20_2 TaxID=3233053 RepID=UPI003F8DDEA7
MCVNYAPIQRQVLRDIFGIEPPARLWADEAWPDTLAPIVTSSDAGRTCALASFSMVPKGKIPPGTRYFPTANARAETVGTLKSFARFWKAGQLALIPASAFYEYAYPEAGTPERPGKPVRWKLWLPDAPGFGIAGLWRAWPDDTLSFTMLTVNADAHPLLSRMHRPGTEKRSVVIVPETEWDDWLRCRDPEVARTFLRLYPSERMAGAPAPMPPAASKAAPDATPDAAPDAEPAPPAPESGSLF